MSKKFKELTKLEIECMEREARSRVAWGAYAATVRQQNLDDDCDRLRLQLRSKGLSSGDIEREVDKHVQSKRTGYLHIGWC